MTDLDTVLLDYSINLQINAYLQEGLDLALALDLLFGHSLGHFAGISVDTSNQGMSEGFLGRTLVVGLDDDGLSAGISSREDKHHLTSFHNLPHFGDEGDVARFSQTIFFYPYGLVYDGTGKGKRKGERKVLWAYKSKQIEISPIFAISSGEYINQEFSR